MHEIVERTHTHSLDMSGYNGATIQIVQGDKGKSWWEAMRNLFDMLQKAGYESDGNSQ
jgi:hypothetical protein